MKKKILSALGKNKQEVINDLSYYLKMPFKAQFEEDRYFEVLRPLYHIDTGLYANNSGELFKWALNKVEK
jgi:hypothetical protein